MPIHLPLKCRGLSDTTISVNAEHNLRHPTTLLEALGHFGSGGNWAGSKEDFNCGKDPEKTKNSQDQIDQKKTKMTTKILSADGRALLKLSKDEVSI